MKITIKQSLVTSVSLLLFVSNAQSQNTNNTEPQFSVDQLQSDFQYLRNKLEANHPGLYLYTPKSEMNKVFDSLGNSISKAMTVKEFYKHITIISSIIKDGHTIILPGEQSSKNAKLLPFHFTINDDHLFADMVCTHDKNIEEGDEIISINGTSAKEIICSMMSRQIRDGNNLTYPTWILNNYFRQYYSFMYGHPEKFEVTYNNKTKEHQTAVIAALASDSIAYYRQLKYPNRNNAKKPNDGLTLQIENNTKTAILTIKDCHKEVLQKEYRQDFKPTIKEYFDQIHEAHIENLILDIRNNQGGDIEYGVFLLSYLLGEPFSVIQEYYCTDDGNGQLKKCSGPSLGLHEPNKNAYIDKLYILINGGSFSNSAIIASCLQHYKRGVFVGEETGGNSNVINGSIKEKELPNTKITVQIPTLQFVIRDKEKNVAHGIMPLHIVKPTISDIIENKDPEKEYVLKLISR